MFSTNASITFTAVVTMIVPPYIDTVDHYPFHAGDVITIRGTDLDLGDTGSVSIGDTLLRPIVQADSTTIIAVIPRETTTGDLTVTNHGGSSTYPIEIEERSTPEWDEYVTCVSWGDPHFTKFSGDVFHFQGYGEYVLASIDNLQVQTRQVSCNTGVTCNVAVAVQVGNSYFAVYKDDLAIYINHTKQNVKDGADIMISEDLELNKVSAYEYRVYTQIGELTIYYNGYFDIYITIPSANIASSAGGLCGPLELYWKVQNGSTFQSPVSQEFVNNYGNTWRVTPTTSIFDYPDNTQYSDYNQPGFEPNDYPSFPSPTDEENAATQCRNLVINTMISDYCSALPQVGYYYEACMNDLAITGDISLAEKSIAAFSRVCYNTGPDNTEYPTLASLSYAEGPGLQPRGVVANIRTTFKIHPMNALGDIQQQEAPGFNVYAVPAIYSFAAQTNEDGTITISYAAEYAGTFLIYIELNSNSLGIRGSPFQVEVGESASCVSWGDPHFTTYTGTHYDFQGLGEYVLTNANGITVQVRHETCGTGVTCNYGLSVSDGNYRLSMYSVNNVISTYAEYVSDSTTQVTLPYYFEGASFVKDYDTQYSIVFDTIMSVVIRDYGRLDVTVHVSTGSYANFVGGLCGTDAPGWTFSNGTEYALDDNPTAPFIHEFGESWRVDNTTSFFNYTVTNSSWPQQNPSNFTPVYTVDPDDTLIPGIIDACSMLMEGSVLYEKCSEFTNTSIYLNSCFFDVAVTNDSSAALSSIVAYASACSGLTPTQNETFPTLNLLSYAEGPGLEDGTPLEDTYFIIHVIDATGSSRITEEDVVSVSLTSSPNGNLSDITFDVTINENADGQYIVDFQGRRPGQVEISVLINGKHIKGSPFTVTFGPYVPVGSLTYASGPGLNSSFIFFDTFFVVTTRNALGEIITTGGEELNIYSDQVSNFVVTDNNDGTYLVEYTTNSAGTYVIDVTLSNEESISGSPFSLTIKELKSEISCISWGDPHFTMFQSRIFNFQGYGEYVLARVGGLEVQVRQAYCNPGVTCNFAIVGREASTTLGINLESRTAVAYINGTKATTFSTAAAVNTISRRSYQYFLSFPSATVEVRAYSTRLDFTVKTYCNGSYPINPLNGGLCGMWNAYLTLGNGTTLVGKYTQKTIDIFGESWRVTEPTSLFNYTNSNYSSNNPTDFVPNYEQNTTNSTIIKEITTVCSVLASGSVVDKCKAAVDNTLFYEACAFDIIATSLGSEGQASVVAYAEACQIATASNSTDSPVATFPVISEHTYAEGPAISNEGVSVSNETYFVIHIIDALGNPSNQSSLNISFSPSVNFNQSNVDLGVINITFTPGGLNNYTVRVTLENGLEISGSPFTIGISLSCTTNASCPSGAYCDTTTMSCKDIDECALGDLATCGAGFTCNNLASTFECIDIDECENENQCAANHKCINLQGSYYCKELTCPGNCNGHGSCVEGLCVCENPYTGPGCEGQSQPLVLTFSTGFPEATIKALSATFSISITEIRELNTYDEVIKSIPLRPFTFLFSNTSDSWIYDSPYSMFNSSTTHLTIKFNYTREQNSYTFANISVTRVPYTLKLTATVTSWSFSSSRNKLVLVTKSSVVQAADACYLPADSANPEANNTLWVTNEIDGATLYGQYLQNALLDGKATEMLTKYDGTIGETLLILPHFYSSATIDPDFSVLLDTNADEPEENEDAADSCDGAIKENKKKKDITTPIVATICSVVGVAAIVAAVMFFRQRQQKRSTMQRLTSARGRSVSSSTTNSML